MALIVLTRTTYAMYHHFTHLENISRASAREAYPMILFLDESRRSIARWSLFIDLLLMLGAVALASFSPAPVVVSSLITCGAVGLGIWLLAAMSCATMTRGL